VWAFRYDQATCLLYRFYSRVKIHPLTQLKDDAMCEANAYLIEGEENRLVMEAVDIVEPENDGVRLISIFGDQKFLKARIHSLSLVDHKIFLK